MLLDAAYSFNSKTVRIVHVTRIPRWFAQNLLVFNMEQGFKVNASTGH
ncbi:MAG TPA: hypothetical protein VGL91_10180 [Acidobacteriota bacterium]